MKSLTPSKDLTLESLRGSCNHDLTLGITRNPPAGLVGLHRFEPVDGTGSLQSRAMLLTRQGISLSSVTLNFPLRGWSFLPTSAYRYAARTLSSPITFRRSAYSL